VVASVDPLCLREVLAERAMMAECFPRETPTFSSAAEAA
jgi:hypothetical protein